MNEPQSLTALVVGSLSLDLCETERRGEPSLADARPGGVVYYAGRALARLGACTRVVTSVAEEDARRLLAPLHAEGIETAARASERTTVYANDYSRRVDLHERRAASDPIRYGDVPREWLESDIIQLGPLHPRDVLPEVAAHVRGFVGLDVQGLVRRDTPRGTRFAPFGDLPLFLEHVDVVKANEQELPAITAGRSAEHFARVNAVSELLVTRGARGVRVVTRERVDEIPAPSVDPRFLAGAGDVFLAAYLMFRVRGRDPVEAARDASEVCGAHISRGEVPKGPAA